jgi:hypothetical protein
MADVRGFGGSFFNKFDVSIPIFLIGHVLIISGNHVELWLASLLAGFHVVESFC